MNDTKEFSGEVLREFRRRHGLTQVEASKVIGIDRTYLARIETGDKVPSARLQRDIEDVIAGFASGRRGLRWREIPVVSWAAAGEASDYQDLAAQIDEMVGTHVADPNAFAVIVEGDSMEPEIKAGDRVVVAPNLEPRNGDVVLVKLKDGRVMVKRFRRVGLNGGIVRLTSENSLYAALEFAVERIRFVYPVIEFKRMLRR